jgi:hypothetical protein
LTCVGARQGRVREIDPREKKARPPQAVACYGEFANKP